MASYIVVIDPVRQKRYQLNIRGHVGQLTRRAIMQALRESLPRHSVSPRASLQEQRNESGGAEPMSVRARHEEKYDDDDDIALGLESGATLVLVQPGKKTTTTTTTHEEEQRPRRNSEDEGEENGKAGAACQLSFCSAAESGLSLRTTLMPALPHTDITAHTTSSSSNHRHHNNYITHSPSPHRPAHAIPVRAPQPTYYATSAAPALSVTTLSPSSTTVFSSSSSSSSTSSHSLSSPQITPSSAFVVPVTSTSSSTSAAQAPSYLNRSCMKKNNGVKTMDGAVSRRVAAARVAFARESRARPVQTPHGNASNGASLWSVKPSPPPASAMFSSSIDPTHNTLTMGDALMQAAALAPPVSLLEDKAHFVASTVSPPRSSMRLLSPSLEQIEAQRYFQSYMSNTNNTNSNHHSHTPSPLQPPPPRATVQDTSSLQNTEQQQAMSVDEDGSRRREQRRHTVSVTSSKPGIGNEGPPLLFTMPDGAYYDARENANENVRRLGEWLGLVQPALQLDALTQSCMVSVEEEYTLLITYDAITERLYLYSSLLTELPARTEEDTHEVRLRLYEFLLEKALLGREMCGGGVGLSVDKQFVMLSTSLYMPTCQPWALRTITPHFVRCLQHWRREVAALLVRLGTRTD